MRYQILPSSHENNELNLYSYKLHCWNLYSAYIFAIILSFTITSLHVLLHLISRRFHLLISRQQINQTFHPNYSTVWLKKGAQINACISNYGDKQALTMNMRTLLTSCSLSHVIFVVTLLANIGAQEHFSTHENIKFNI